MANKPRPPRDLRDSGAEFWRATYAAYELDARDVPVLHEVCRVLDEIDCLAAAVAATGVLSTGSAGQVVEHPALAGLRAHRTVLDRLLVRLGLPSSEGVAPSSAQQLRAQKAAAARWRGHVPRGADSA